MKIPKSDKTLNCKAQFEDGEVNRCRFLFRDIRAPGEDRTTKLEQTDNAVKVTNECATDFRFCIDNQELWIVTHGMSSDTNVFGKGHQAILNQLDKTFSGKKPMTLFYHWGNFSKDANPFIAHNVDQYETYQTSYELSLRLKKWGLSDLSILNLVGHSMGDRKSVV